jgi:hypothetical protein
MGDTEATQQYADLYLSRLNWERTRSAEHRQDFLGDSSGDETNSPVIRVRERNGATGDRITHSMPRPRLTKAKWAKLKRAFVYGHSLGAIAQATGVSRGTLSAYSTRHKWSRNRVAGTEILRKGMEWE